MNIKYNVAKLRIISALCILIHEHLYEYSLIYITCNTTNEIQGVIVFQ